MRVGQRNLDGRRAELFVFGNGGAHGGHHLGIAALAEKFLGQADAQAVQRLVQIAGVILERAVERGRIALVETGHGVEQQRAVLGARRHRAALVER